MFETTGIIKYEPKRQVASTWWLTVELPRFEDTSRYYRWFIDREWWIADSSPVKRKYSRSAHAAHVSIIRGEKPRKNVEDWGKYLVDKRVKVRYDPYVRQTTKAVDGKDTFWFVDAYVDGYAEIRKHFGLDYQRNGVPFKGHITIAKVH